MELVTSPKSSYLLEAGLEVLHEQSNEWLSEIAFWRHEAAFFHSLIVRRTLFSVPITAKDSLLKIEKDLEELVWVQLDELQKEVVNHESFLAHLLVSKSNDEELYRKKHREMAVKFEEFEIRFRLLKREVFALAELVGKKAE